MDFAASPLEIKALDDSGSIEGLLAGFNTIDSHGDRILPGAFAKSLRERGKRPLPMLLHHDQRRPIGRWTEWNERASGLYVKGRLTLDTQDGQEARALARDGALTGLSIGFIPTKVRRTNDATDLVEINLIEGSLVAIPSNPDTYVSSVKAIGGARDIEELLSAGGLSSRRAKAAASAAWRAINTNDSQSEDDELAAIFAAANARLHNL